MIKKKNTSNKLEIEGKFLDMIQLTLDSMTENLPASGGKAFLRQLNIKKKSKLTNEFIIFKNQLYIYIY